MDSKLKSLTEAFVNIIPGFIISYLSNLYILPYFAEGIMVSDFFTLFQISIWFTVISLIRSYVFRRLFERMGEHENFYTFTKRTMKHLYN